MMGDIVLTDDALWCRLGEQGASDSNKAGLNTSGLYSLARGETKGLKGWRFGPAEAVCVLSGRTLGTSLLPFRLSSAPHCCALSDGRDSLAATESRALCMSHTGAGMILASEAA